MQKAAALRPKHRAFRKRSYKKITPSSKFAAFLNVFTRQHYHVPYGSIEAGPNRGASAKEIWDKSRIMRKSKNSQAKA
jgi:hypothetical protein